MASVAESLSAKAIRLADEFDVQLAKAEKLATSHTEILTQEIWNALAPALGALATAVQKAAESAEEVDTDYDGSSFDRDFLQGRIDDIKPKAHESSSARGSDDDESLRKVGQHSSQNHPSTSSSLSCGKVTAAAVVLFAVLVYFNPPSANSWWHRSLV